jgi:hypothetical protein
LSLSEVAAHFGVTITRQGLMKRIRRMERRTGRTILIVDGDGDGRRYMVNPDELAAAMNAAPIARREPDDIDDIANKIADAVNAMNDRISEMSQRLRQTQAELADIQKRLARQR